jgi:hypothetical protein
MERPSSGLKECPRCGLKNRPGSSQCDFCGWDFKASTDDWISQVKDLEKAVRDLDDHRMDEKTRSKIELTMNKPTASPVREQKPEGELEVPPHLTLEDHGDVLQAATAEAMPVPEPSIELPVPEPTILVKEPTTIAAAPVHEPITEKAAKVPASSEVAATPAEKTARGKYIQPAALLAGGVILYGVDIFLTTSGSLSRPVGWAVAIVASLLLVVAVMKIWPLLKIGTSDDEVVLCPKCHEEVTENVTECPSCGANFKGS